MRAFHYTNAATRRTSAKQPRTMDKTHISLV